MIRVRLDRRLGVRSLLLALLLCWPLLMFGSPAYFNDSPSYYKGGKAAVTFLAQRLLPSAPVEKRAGEAAVPVEAVSSAADAKGARSISYSVVAYLLRGPGGGMAPLVLLQSLALAFAATVFLLAGGADSPRRFWAAAILLAVATPAAWFADFVMPDIFAGITILVLATMTFLRRYLSGAVAVLLLLLGAFAISAHASHVGIALILLPCSLIWCGIRRWRGGEAGIVRPMLWVSAPTVLGCLIVIVSGYIGFGEVSVAPKHYPLTLASSIEAGPARWYLDEHCATKHYEVCTFFHGHMPATSFQFLWGPDGISRRATPAQMDRLRAEEGEIVLNAARAYPSAQANAVSKGVLDQVWHFALGEARFDLRIAFDGVGQPILIGADDKAMPFRRTVELLGQISAALGLLYILASMLAASPDRRALAAFIVAGLLANAAICAVFSAVADRYQARVVWLLPLTAMIMPRPKLPRGMARA